MSRDMIQINCLPNRVIAVVLLSLPLACATGQGAAFPEVTAEQFKLDLDADRAQVGSGRPLPIRHRLVNSSAVSVCVGGIQIFRLNGRRNQANILHHALCDSPLAVVPPGGAIEWAIEWRTNPNCENFPFMICGILVELTSEITVYRMYGDSPLRPGIGIVSAHQQVQLKAPEP